MRALLLLPLLGGCWLGNDFSRFEHGDGGAAVRDLSEADESAVSDAAESIDASMENVDQRSPGDGGIPCGVTLSWTTTTPFPNGVVGPTVITMPGKPPRMFVVGGCTAPTCGTSEPTTRELFELDGDLKWQRRDADLAGPQAFAAGAALSTELVLVGSDYNPEQLTINAVLDMDTSALESKSPWTTTGPHGVAGAVADGTFYVAGGMQSGGPIGQVVRYDSATGAWLDDTTLTFGRSNAGLATYGTELWAMGGADETGTSIDSVEVAQLGSSPLAWSTGPALPQRLQSFATVTGADGNVYVIGGLDDSNNHLSTVYSTCAGAWTARNGLTSTLSESSAGLGPDGRIYVVGGLEPNGIASKESTDVFVYGPQLAATAVVNDSFTIRITAGSFPAGSTVSITKGQSVTQLPASALGEPAGADVAGGPGVYTVMDDMSFYPLTLVVRD